MKKNKKHLLLIVKHPVGGIRSFIRYIYKFNYFNDYKITIILADSDDSEGFISALSDINIDFILSKNTNLSIIKTINIAVKENKIDIIHSHGYTSAFCAVFISKLSNIKHIMTVHDSLSEKQFSGLKGYLKLKLLTFLYNRLDYIHAVSYDVKDNIYRYFKKINNNKIITIINGIDIDQFNNVTKRDLRAEFNINENFMILGFLGRFMSLKGFTILINAIELLHKKYKNDLNIVVVAIGSGGFIREDKQLINEKNLKSYFIFTPPVNEVSATLNGLDVIVMPSLSEACPLLAMETLVSGKPLIASNCVGLREVIRDTPAIEVEAGNAESLANAIDDYKNNPRPDLFKEYQSIGRERFDAEATAKSIYNLYYNMLN